MSIVVEHAVLPPSAPPTPVIDNEALFEIIDGQRVELPSMGTWSIAVTNTIMYHLEAAARQEELGHAYTEMLFHLPWPGTRNRRPDVAFVSFHRWPKDRVLNDENGWHVVPDLAVEVVSPSDLGSELVDKLEEYFHSGVRLVWVVYPNHGLVYVYESMTQVRGLSRDETLDGGAVLPRFRLALSELFPATNLP